MDVPEPAWFTDFVSHHLAQNTTTVPARKKSFIMNVKEWDNEASRALDGFKGTDFCHSVNSPVRILNYFVYHIEEDPFPRLVAPVLFTPKAESGRGYCHGGSMCAVMDDAIGWMGFAVRGEVHPWKGFTVQVNTTLKKSIPVGSLLKLHASVERLEGQRKVWIRSSLVDPADESVIHCVGSGLFLMPAGQSLVPISPISPSTSSTELSASTLNSVFSTTNATA